ncbi:hypothetical protein KY284_007820 [Solanum tuberosum]|nr:hypothetical protein KY284_007820 [Solanum tuberosum]
MESLQNPNFKDKNPKKLGFIPKKGIIKNCKPTLSRSASWKPNLTVTGGMATASNGWPLLSVGEPPPIPPTTSYLTSLPQDLNKPTNPITIPVKEIIVTHGEPSVLWEEEEVNNMILQENLQYAIVGKFSYGWPELDEIRKIVPLQYDIKAKCNISFLRDRHILIRLTSMDKYVYVMSKSAYFLMANDGYYKIRTLKWVPWFNFDE